MVQVYIGLGSNLGDRRANLRRSVEALDAEGLPPEALSSVWESAPVGCREPARFLNMVARLETELAPERVLARLLRIERAAGRVRRTRNEPRVLDLDLLLAGEHRRESAQLVLPHPRMWCRRFVLAPLAELDPSLEHPDSGRSVAELERELRFGQPDVVRIGPLGTDAPGAIIPTFPPGAHLR